MEISSFNVMFRIVEMLYATYKYDRCLLPKEDLNWITVMGGRGGGVAGMQLASAGLSVDCFVLSSYVSKPYIQNFNNLHYVQRGAC
jgi:hypothetical protein